MLQIGMCENVVESCLVAPGLAGIVMFRPGSAESRGFGLLIAGLGFQKTLVPGPKSPANDGLGLALAAACNSNSTLIK